jgi:hypothetical protein
LRNKRKEFKDFNHQSFQRNLQYIPSFYQETVERCPQFNQLDWETQGSQPIKNVQKSPQTLRCSVPGEKSGHNQSKSYDTLWSFSLSFINSQRYIPYHPLKWPVVLMKLRTSTACKVCNGPFSGGEHQTINITNIHFIHASLAQGPIYLSIYLSIYSHMCYLVRFPWSPTST